MTPKIFPMQLAENLKARAGEKYRPSNGTEGEIFFDHWCRHCARDKAMREGCDFEEVDDNESCEIIAATMAFDVDENGYPGEWQYSPEGQPYCTAFVRDGDRIPTPRCTMTQELF